MQVKVSAVSFSQNEKLVNSLLEKIPGSIVNNSGTRFNENTVVDYFKDADAVIVGLEPMTAKVIAALPNLKFISKFGVGLDNIDLDACRERNIGIGWTGGVNRRSVAEMALGFMLMLLRNLYVTSNKLKNQVVWEKKGGVNLTGRIVGIIGLGNIGKDLVSLLAPFGCTILVNDVEDISEYAKIAGVQSATKEEIYAVADIISIHTPLTAETKDLFNAEVFRRMKRNAFVINTARGGIINEKDLKEALMNQTIMGAAIDVYEQEPPTDRELLSLPNLITTPHIGGNSYESVVAMGESAIHHLYKFYQQYQSAHIKS